MNTISRRISILLSLALPLVAIAAGQPPQTDAAAAAVAQEALTSASSPLVDKVRKATARFKDINAALAAGFVQGTPCVSGPDFGAMGVHFVLPARINAAVLKADQPEALIYEPLPSGALRLVGVEFIILANVWQTENPTAGPPALEGHLMNFIDAPNRYGLPAFYELHVWAWEHNPVGSFADWNTHVTCDQQAAS
jgi:hypothetical protein